MDNFWDVAYANGDHLTHWESPSAPAELAVAVAAGLVAPGSRVLDLGCGGGLEAIFLAGLGFRAVGVDSSAVALDLARRRAAEAGVEVDFRLAEVTELPLADGSVGFATDRGCFHVLDEDWRPGYARELERVLEPGASLLLRGARVTSDEEGFFAVDAAEVDRYFSPPRFSRGPVVPIELVSAAETLEGNLVVLRKRPLTPEGVRG